MTFIQPKKTLNSVNFIVATLAVLCVLGTFWLIALYNNVVNVNHNIAAMKTQLDAVGAESTSINNQIIGMLGTGGVATTAQADGLIAEKDPQYFQTNQSWAFDSQP